MHLCKRMKRGRDGASRTPTGKRQKTTRITPIPVRSPKRTMTANRVRSMSGVEKKYLDTNDSATITAAGVISGSLTTVPEGTTDVSRVGNKITVTNVNIRFVILVDDRTTAVIFNRNVRFILYIDRQANGSTPQPSEIIGVPTSVEYRSYRNLDSVDRFVILHDSFIHVPMITTNAAHTMIGPTKVYTLNKKIECPIHYNGTTGATTEVRSNNIGFLMVCDTPPNPYTQGIGYEALVRIKYIDS